MMMNTHNQLEQILKDMGRDQFRRWYREGQDKYKPLHDELVKKQDYVRLYVVHKYNMYHEALRA